MSDEEFGRAYAAQMGWEPARIGEFFAWHNAADPNLPGEVPPAVRFDGRMWLRSEAESFAALGRAVRAVHAAVPLLKELT